MRGLGIEIVHKSVLVIFLCVLARTHSQAWLLS